MQSEFRASHRRVGRAAWGAGNTDAGRARASSGAAGPHRVSGAAGGTWSVELGRERQRSHRSSGTDMRHCCQTAAVWPPLSGPLRPHRGPGKLGSRGTPDARWSAVGGAASWGSPQAPTGVSGQAAPGVLPNTAPTAKGTRAPSRRRSHAGGENVNGPFRERTPYFPYNCFTWLLTGEARFLHSVK